MRRLLLALLIAALAAFPAQAEAPGISITVDGAPLQMDVQPRLIDGRVMVPARFVAEALGGQVKWDGETRTVRITHKLTPQPALFMDKAFEQRIYSAEAYIRDHAPEYYQEYIENVHVIIQGYKSQAVPYKRTVVLDPANVPNEEELVTRLIHETEHIIQYFKGMPFGFANKQEAEDRAIAKEIAFWKRVGGHEERLRDLQSLLGRKWWEEGR